MNDTEEYPHIESVRKVQDAIYCFASIDAVTKPEWSFSSHAECIYEFVFGDEPLPIDAPLSKVRAGELERLLNVGMHTTQRAEQMNLPAVSLPAALEAVRRAMRGLF